MGNVRVVIHSKHLTIQRLRSVYEKGALPILAEQILSDCNTYVRMQDGTLADSARIENGGKHLTWNTPYAKKVYYTGKPLRNKNKKATLRWCEIAERIFSKSWAELATKLVKGG